MPRIIILSSVFFSFILASEDATWMTSWIMPSPGILIWTLITFFIVLGILKWKAWGPLMKVLDDREKRISKWSSKGGGYIGSSIVPKY